MVLYSKASCYKLFKTLMQGLVIPEVITIIALVDMCLLFYRPFQNSLFKLCIIQFIIISWKHHIVNVANTLYLGKFRCSLERNEGTQYYKTSYHVRLLYLLYWDYILTYVHKITCIHLFSEQCVLCRRRSIKKVLSFFSVCCIPSLKSLRNLTVKSYALNKISVMGTHFIRHIYRSATLTMDYRMGINPV